MPPAPRIAIVEDDPSIAEVLALRLDGAGFEVHRYSDGPTALADAERFWPDLVVLDLGLPGMDGLVVLERLHRLGDVPVLILTARGESRHKVRGLELGADDYVVKPFDTEEVLARIRVLLRRAGRLAAETAVAGELRVDRAQYAVFVGPKTVSLSPREVDLLFALVQAQNRALTRLQLLDRVWGPDADVEPRVVDAFVTRLRRKLAEAWGEASPTPWDIATVWGVGYRFSLRRPDADGKA